MMQYTDKTDLENLPKWRKRRRWAKVAWIYGLMLMISVFFIMPYIIAGLASLKINPLETPFTYVFERVKPSNWIAAGKLGMQGSGRFFWGGFESGKDITLNFRVVAPKDEKYIEPIAEIPQLKAGSGTAMLGLNAQPKDFLTISPLMETAQPKETTISYTKKGEQIHMKGLIRSYEVKVSYATEGPKLQYVPFVLKFPNRKYQLVDATLPNDRLERRGKIASWENIAPGWLGYTLYNYVRAVDNDRDLNTGKSYLLQWFKNSFFISLGRVFYQVSMAVLGGYALARLSFPGKALLFSLILFSIAIPDQMTFISNYLVLRDMSMLNMGGVIMVAIAAPQIFIMKQFFENIPRVLEEAAILDGASHFNIFRHVVMPLAGPPLVAVTIMAFQSAWNDFFWPLVIITSPKEALALPVGLLSFRETYGIAGDWGMILSGAIISMIPMLIIFAVFQRYFVENNSNAGIK